MFEGLKKSGPKPVAATTVEEASVGSSGYPGDYSVASLRERRLLMALRAVSIALFGAITVVVIEAFLLASLMPMKEIRPFLVQVSDEGAVVASIKPIQDTFEAKNVLTEKLVRDYVINRHEILRSTPIMTTRWSKSGYMGTTTDEAEYNRFVNSVSAVMDEVRQQNAQRRARVLGVTTVEAGSVYIVEFRSTTYDSNDRKIAETTYTASVEVEFRPLKDLTKEEMLINPTGFTVVNYTLAEKDQ